MKIGVVDTGVDPSSPFLDPSGFPYPPGFPKGDTKQTTPKVIVARVFPGPVRDKNSNKAFDPTEPHGTHVSGIAAGDEGTTAPAGPDHPATTDLSGVAPTAWIGNYRVFTVPTPLGHEANTPEIVRAFEAAVADGMNVINFSGGGPETDPANDAMNETVHNTALAGVVPVIAAGNDREDFGLGTAGSPGTAPDAISVAATSRTRTSSPRRSPSSAARRHSAPCRSRAQAAPSSRRLVDARPDARRRLERARHRRQAGRHAPLRLGHRPEQRPRHARRRTRSPARSRSSRAASARSSRRRHARAIGGAIGHHRDRQPLRRGEPDPDPAAAADRDDLRPRRRESARLRGGERRAGVDPGLDRHPGDPDEPQRRHHELLVGRPDRLRPLPEAGLSAPGLDVLSSTPPLTTGSTFSVFAGTSMATPHVAGAAALLLQQHPGWSSWQVKSALMSTAGPAWGDTARTQEAPVLLEGAGLANVAAANDPKIFTDPQSLSFQRIDVSTGAQRRSMLLTLSDAGDGAGTWSASVAPQAQTHRRHDRRSRPVDDRARRRRRHPGRRPRRRQRDRRRELRLHRPQRERRPAPRPLRVPRRAPRAPRRTRDEAEEVPDRRHDATARTASPRTAARRSRSGRRPTTSARR